MAPKELSWKFGPTALRILDSLTKRTRKTRDLPPSYLNEAQLEDLNVEAVPWDLRDTHPFFKCMSPNTFDKLRPSKPIEPISDPEPPSSKPPTNVHEHEECSRLICSMFQYLHESKVSVDGGGCVWPDQPGFWTPRKLLQYEDMYSYARLEPNVPYQVERSYATTSDKPHVVYHVTFADSISDDTISKDEVYIFFRMIKGRLWHPKYCMHIAPVSIPVPRLPSQHALIHKQIMMLSIHSNKARIMTANVDPSNERVYIKYSKLVQFDGFREKEKRLDNIIRDRDHFFRWLNPICSGGTELEDSKNAEELVLRTNKRGERVFAPLYGESEDSSADSQSSAST